MNDNVENDQSVTASEQPSNTIATMASNSNAPTTTITAQVADFELSVIERLALNPDIDLGRMKILIDMKNAEQDRLAEMCFNQAMAETQNAIQSIVTNQRNTHTKSNYADLAAIHNEAKPEWTTRGFSVGSTVKESEKDNHIKVITTVRHSGGYKEHHENDWPLDTHGAQGNVNKTPLHGMGSTLQYARRYSELMIFDISTKDDDDGNGAHKLSQGNTPAFQPITPQQADTIYVALKKADMDVISFCVKADIEQLSHLPQGRVAGSLKMLNHRAVNNARRAGAST